MSETIYVATEDHEAQLPHGGTMKIRAGFWAAEGHELIKSHPDKWRVGARPQSERAASEQRGGLDTSSAPLLSDGSAGAFDDAPAEPLSERIFDGDDAWQAWLQEQPSILSELHRDDVGRARSKRSVSEVEFRPQAAPGVVIRLSSAASRDLNTEARRSRPRTISIARRDRYESGLYEDGVESGGYLFGRFTRDALADVDPVIGAGANAVATSTSITFEAGDTPASAFERELREVFDNRDIRLVGDWHVHPNGVGEGRPSADDLRAWAQLFERIEEERSASRFLGLIGVSEGGNGCLFRVGWHAWVVSRTPVGRLIYEPAHLEGA